MIMFADLTDCYYSSKPRSTSASPSKRARRLSGILGEFGTLPFLSIPSFLCSLLALSFDRVTFPKRGYVGYLLRA
jgi:hypothetical protein